jgi:hypothetical protein
VDAREQRDGLAARALAQERSRLFEQQAEAYERFRPTSPEGLIDELLGSRHLGMAVSSTTVGVAGRQDEGVVPR